MRLLEQNKYLACWVVGLCPFVCPFVSMHHCPPRPTTLLVLHEPYGGPHVHIAVTNKRLLACLVVLNLVDGY